MTDSSHSQELVRQGQAAAMVGRRGEARDILRRAVELDPKRVDAWLALAGVEDDPADKIACFEKVLSLAAPGPEEPSFTGSNGTVDWDKAMKAVQGDRHMLCELSESFLTEYPDVLAQIREAIDDSL